MNAEVKEKVAQVSQVFEHACCFQTLGEGSVAFTPCGHTYCNRASCLSAQETECPECRQAMAGRVVLFGALANVKAALAAGGAIAD
jgi:hypothetical protein